MKKSVRNLEIVKSCIQAGLSKEETQGWLDWAEESLENPDESIDELSEFLGVDLSEKISSEDYKEMKEVFERRKKQIISDQELLLSKIDVQFARLQSLYMKSNMDIPIGSKVKVTVRNRKDIEVREGVLIDYKIYDSLHYIVSFPPRTERCYDVYDCSVKIEVLE